MFFPDRKEMISTKVQIAELAEKVEKLEKRLKKDEKLGVIYGFNQLITYLNCFSIFYIFDGTPCSEKRRQWNNEMKVMKMLRNTANN